MSFEPLGGAVLYTIKAQTKNTLNFASYHRRLGLTQPCLFLDFSDPAAQRHLQKHPNIHVTNTGLDNWQAQSRFPKTVERRQIEMTNSAVEFARRDNIP